MENVIIIIRVNNILLCIASKYRLPTQKESKRWKLGEVSGSKAKFSRKVPNLQSLLFNMLSRGLS